MDDAARVRDAAREALSDIEPPSLRQAIYDRLANAEMTPGVLTLVSARALDSEVRLAGLAERAAGVQLIYEGLRLTRVLAHEEPWSNADLDSPGDLEADIDVLAADVLVARGFYCLARTAAAEQAVETVRRFGRDQTHRREAADPAVLDRNLEADVFELAVVAGTTAVGGSAPPDLLAYAADLAREADGLPAAEALPESTNDRIATLADGPIASSVDP